MELRSGKIIRNNINIDKCKKFIGNLHSFVSELEDYEECRIGSLCINSRMYRYINNEINNNNISNHLKICSGLEAFLIGVANNIPLLVLDLISIKRDNDNHSVAWTLERDHYRNVMLNEPTGLNYIENAKMFNELTGLNYTENAKMLYKLRVYILSNFDNQIR
jgi:hypothetical protein